MATKVYGVSGYTTTILRVPAGDGKAWIECEFTRGCPNNGAYFRPATYVTKDKTAQSIIEHSPYFGKLIKLVKVYEDEPGSASVQAPAEEQRPSEPAAAPVIDKAEPKPHPEVKSYDEAITVLKSLGAKATQLRTIEAVKKYMAQMNVTFPNYNFDK